MSEAHRTQHSDILEASPSVKAFTDKYIGIFLNSQEQRDVDTLLAAIRAEQQQKSDAKERAAGALIAAEIDRIQRLQQQARPLSGDSDGEEAQAQSSESNDGHELSTDRSQGAGGTPEEVEGAAPPVVRRSLVCDCGNKDDEDVADVTQPLPPCSAGCGRTMRLIIPTVDTVIKAFAGAEVTLIVDGISLPVRITRIGRQPLSLIRIEGAFVSDGIPSQTKA